MTVVLQQYTLHCAYSGFLNNSSDIVTILNLIVDHHKMGTAVLFEEYKSYIVVTIQSFMKLLLLGIVEYLISQTMMVII